MHSICHLCSDRFCCYRLLIIYPSYLRFSLRYPPRRLSPSYLISSLHLLSPPSHSPSTSPTSPQPLELLMISDTTTLLSHPIRRLLIPAQDKLNGKLKEIDNQSQWQENRSYVICLQTQDAHRHMPLHFHPAQFLSDACHNYWPMEPSRDKRCGSTRVFNEAFRGKTSQFFDEASVEIDLPVYKHELNRHDVICGCSCSDMIYLVRRTGGWMTVSLAQQQFTTMIISHFQSSQPPSMSQSESRQETSERRSRQWIPQPQPWRQSRIFGTTPPAF